MEKGCVSCGGRFEEGEAMERHNCDYSLEKQKEQESQRDLEFKAVWYAFLANPPWSVKQ